MKSLRMCVGEEKEIEIIGNDPQNKLKKKKKLFFKRINYLVL